MSTCTCGHEYDEHDARYQSCDVEGCLCIHYEGDDEDRTMVDLGGGMVVPLAELLEDD